MIGTIRHKQLTTLGKSKTMEVQHQTSMDGAYILPTSEASPDFIGESPKISLKTPTEASLVEESDFTQVK